MHHRPPAGAPPPSPWVRLQTDVATIGDFTVMVPRAGGTATPGRGFSQEEADDIFAACFVASLDPAGPSRDPEPPVGPGLGRTLMKGALGLLVGGTLVGLALSLDLAGRLNGLQQRLLDVYYPGASGAVVLLAVAVLWALAWSALDDRLGRGAPTPGPPRTPLANVTLACLGLIGAVWLGGAIVYQSKRYVARGDAEATYVPVSLTSAQALPRPLPDAMAVEARILLERTLEVRSEGSTERGERYMPLVDDQWTPSAPLELVLRVASEDPFPASTPRPIGLHQAPAPRTPLLVRLGGGLPAPVRARWEASGVRLSADAVLVRRVEQRDGRPLPVDGAVDLERTLLLCGALSLLVLILMGGSLLVLRRQLADRRRFSARRPG
jgi:hypothetical protein